MLNSLNLLSSFSDKLIDQQTSMQGVIQSYLDAIEEELGALSIVFDGESYEHTLPFEEHDKLFAMFSALKERTLMYDDGYVSYLLDEQTQDDDYTIHQFVDVMHNDRNVATFIVETPSQGHTPENFIFGFQGWEHDAHGECDRLIYVFKSYLNTQSISNTVMEAITLCVKGRLTASEFVATLTADGISMQDDVKRTVNTIISKVSGSAANEQAIGLIDALHEIYASAKQGNITEEDGRINFHTNEFSINGSVLLLPSTLIATIGGVISLVVSYFAPVFGAAIALVSSAFSGLYHYLNQEIGNEWNINPSASLDNEAFSTPLLSGKYPIYAVESYIPQNIIDYTAKYGYLRSENAFFMMYTWITQNDPNFINIELFPNVNVNYRINWDVDLNLLTQHITSCVSQYQFVGYPAYENNAGERVNIDYWFAGENNSFSPADVPKIQLPDAKLYAHKDYQNKATTFSYLYQLAFWAYRILTLYYGTGTSTRIRPSTPVDAWFSAHDYDGIAIATEDDCIDMLQSFLYYMNLGTHQSSSDLNWVDSWIKLNNWNELTYGAVMCIYKCFQRLRTIDGTKYDLNLLRDVFTIFNSSIPMGDITNNRDLIGWGSTWSSTPFFDFSTDFLMSPPKNRYSIATKLYATAAVVISLSVLTLGLGSAARRRIQYKAQERRNELDTLRSQYMESGTYEDWNTYRKATKKYNKTYGLLTGTKYDTANAWYDSTKSVADSASSIPVLDNSYAESADGTVTINLEPVIKLIK